MNIQYPKLPFVKLTPQTFYPLRGMSIPAKSMRNSGAVGRYIDNLIKTQLKNPSHLSTVVDLNKFGIEIKTKDTDTNTCWSIGSMTIKDIVDTPYVNSSIYQKMQALLLVTTDDKFRVVTGTLLVYMDIDEVQCLIHDTYEDLRSQLTVIWNAYLQKVNAHLAAGELAEAQEPIQFKSWFNVKGDYGMFEYMSGTSFQFRLTQRQMTFLTDTALKTQGFSRIFAD